MPTVLVLAIISIPISIADVRERRIPDAWLLAGALALIVVRGLAREQVTPLGLLGPPAAGFLAFLAVRHAAGGRLGMGDVKLSALIAFAAGAAGWLVAVLLASAAGLLFALTASAAGLRKISDPLPFGPFLCAGAVTAVLMEPLYRSLIPL